MEQASAVWGGQYIHGISAPMHEIEARVMNELRDERVKELASQNLTSEQGKFMTQGSEKDMEAANLGVKMATTTPSKTSQPSSTFDHLSFKKRKGISAAKKRSGNRRKW